MDERSSLGTVSKRGCVFRNARARNTHVEATSNHSCAAQAAADRGDPGALRRSILKLQNRKTLRERHRLLRLLLSESYVFLHKSPPCVVWDVSIMLLLLYVIVMVPIFIGFDWDSDEGGVVYTIGMIIDIFFLVDVAINFNLSYTDEFTKDTVEDRGRVVRRYLPVR